jgi:CHAT domain-containing protein/tetratricopeptide (TPR) repeat protein
MLRAAMVCASCSAVGLAVLGGASSSWPSNPDLQLPRLDLRPGAVVERRMAGGETHVYGVEVGTAARLLVTVEQQGIDVEVALRGADRRTLITVDGPTRRDGPESLLVPREAMGHLEIRVRAPGPGAAPGSYVLRLQELGESTAAERERLAAERLMTDAAAHNWQGSAASLRLGAAEYRDALAHWQALGRRPEEARCALSAAEMLASLGQPKAALTLFEQALARFEELADGLGQEAAWRGIGLARTALGDPAAAVAAQRRALALARGLGRPHLAGDALDNLGLALHAQGDVRAARELFEQALAAFDLAGERGAWRAAVLQNLAAVAADLGEPEAALERHRQVLALQRALGSAPGEARTLNNLGVLYGNLGELGKALDSYTPALAIFRRDGDRLWEAVVLHNRGSAYYALGDFRRAQDDLERALTIRRDAGDKRGEVRSEINLGQTLFRLGERARALHLGAHAVTVASAASDRGGEMLARLLVARIELATGSPAAALAGLVRPTELARAMEDRLGEAAALQFAGEAHLALGQPEQAAPILAQAVSLSRAVESPARTVSALTALARAERMLGRAAAARSRVDEALGLIEVLRTTESDPDLRASFLASQRTAFELEIDLLMELHRGMPGQGYDRQALEVSERAHARGLLDLLAEAHADIRAGVEPALRDRERALLARLNAKASRRAALLGAPAAERRPHVGEDEIRSVLDELARVQAEIRRRSPRYAALTQPVPVTSREVQDLLDGDSLLLEYALGGERSYLWAVDRDSVTGVALPRRAEIEAAARAVYSDLGVVGPRGVGQEDAASLSRMLLGPVAARLGKRRLIVVADGDLQYLPFGMLPVPREQGAKAAAGAAGAPLLAEHEIVSVPSASVVAAQRRGARRPPAQGLVAVLADPVFDARDPRVTAAAGRRASPSGNGPRPRAGSPNDPFPRLPWTRREAAAIAAVAPAGESLLALGFEASRETALSPALARYRIVHFATHGVIDARTPALSGLMLSRIGEQGDAREGFLGLADIYNLRLGADLVVLSGCETALGKQVNGEGLVGLTQGFLYAGARQVVASLWRVEDRATAELMSRFYRGLLVDRRPAAAALRLAQLAIRHDRRWRSPYYWSGFLAQGDWR